MNDINAQSLENFLLIITKLPQKIDSEKTHPSALAYFENILKYQTKISNLLKTRQKVPKLRWSLFELFEPL